MGQHFAREKKKMKRQQPTLLGDGTRRSTETDDEVRDLIRRKEGKKSLYRQVQSEM